ncbi:nucleotide pyrophosphohydrolase [Streptomyces bobili]|uniref:nucleotide pyrophosphohydrolase n=1 Tax=Streptomyces bobili TaxID=67280 RepID=UPI00378E09EA
MHTPKNAVMAPAGKGANLLELFAVADTAAVWSGEDDERAVQSRQERADVLACLHRPADALHLCLHAVLAEKIEKKYRTSPVHLARGKADTYTQLGG